MADNYLERKMEEYRNRQGTPLRMAKNLEKLLRDCSEEQTPDTEYNVHPMQLDAICSVCAKVNTGNIVPELEQGQDGPFGTIRLVLESEDVVTASFAAGRLVEAMALKAAELCLILTIAELCAMSENSYSVFLRVFKGKTHD